MMRPSKTDAELEARAATRRWNAGLLWCLAALVFCLPLLAAPDVILVIGEPGQAEYAERFDEAHAAWTNLFAKGNIEATIIGVASNDTSDLEQLQISLTNASTSADPPWLILYGHGSHDGRDGKFNLRGPDITAKQLAKAMPNRPQVVVAAFASSIAFLPELTATNRVVVSATRDLGEDSFSYFGGFLPEALASPEADVDQDGAVSLLEGWLLAAKLTDEHYVNEQRILTENPLLDDNGDGKGTPANAFTGLRAKPLVDGATADGNRARQLYLVPSPAELALSPEARAERDALERELLVLRDRKSGIAEDRYYEQLKPILLKLARFYEEQEAQEEQE